MKDRQILGLYCKDRLKKAIKFTVKLSPAFTMEELPYLFLVFFIYTWEKSALLMPHGKKKTLNEKCSFPM